LLWKNIKPVGANEVRIKLSESQTKNEKERTVIGRRADVFKKIRKYSNHTKPNDYVFVNNTTGKQLSRHTYYANFEYLVEQTKLDNNRELQVIIVLGTPTQLGDYTQVLMYFPYHGI